MEKRVSMDMRAIYAVVAFIAMLISSNLSYWIVNAIFKSTLTNIAVYVLALLIMTALHLVISWGVTAVFLFIKFPSLYHRSEDKNMWAKKTVSLVIVGEIARFLGCVLFFRRYLDKVSSEWYNIIYGAWVDKYTFGPLNVIDSAVYALIYLAITAVFLTGVFFMCKKLWELGKKDFENIYGKKETE